MTFSILKLKKIFYAVLPLLFLVNATSAMAVWVEPNQVIPPELPADQSSFPPDVINIGLPSQTKVGDLSLLSLLTNGGAFGSLGVSLNPPSTNGNVLIGDSVRVDGSGQFCLGNPPVCISSWQQASGLSGAVNHLSKWTDASHVSDSSITETDTDVNVGANLSAVTSINNSLNISSGSPGKSGLVLKGLSNFIPSVTSKSNLALSVDSQGNIILVKLVGGGISSCTPSTVVSTTGCAMTSCDATSHQTKTCPTTVTNADCTTSSGTQVTTESCARTCTPTNFVLSPDPCTTAWSVCDSTGHQTRSCPTAKTNADCSLTNGTQTQMQSCVPPLSCTAEPTTIDLVHGVTLTASGGNGTYSWTAPGGSNAYYDTINNLVAPDWGSSMAVYYNSVGQNTVTVSSDGLVASCPVITVTPIGLPPLVCNVNTPIVQTNLSANMYATGGDGNYVWNAPGSVYTSVQPSTYSPTGFFYSSYSSSGSKTVTVTSAGQSVNCSSITINQGNPISCSITPSIAATNQVVTLNYNRQYGALNPDLGGGQYVSADSLSSNSTWEKFYYDTPGNKTVAVTDPVSGQSSSCSVVINSQLACSVDTPNVNVNSAAQLSASGGDNNFTWTASNNASYTNVLASNTSPTGIFNVKFSTPGQEIVNVKSAGQSVNCSVINVGSCTQSSVVGTSCALSSCDTTGHQTKTCPTTVTNADCSTSSGTQVTTQACAASPSQPLSLGAAPSCDQSALGSLMTINSVGIVNVSWQPPTSVGTGTGLKYRIQRCGGFQSQNPYGACDFSTVDFDTTTSQTSYADKTVGYYNTSSYNPIDPNNVNKSSPSWTYYYRVRAETTDSNGATLSSSFTNPVSVGQPKCIPTQSSLQIEHLEVWCPDYWYGGASNSIHGVPIISAELTGGVPTQSNGRGDWSPYPGSIVSGYCYSTGDGNHYNDHNGVAMTAVTVKFRDDNGLEASYVVPAIGDVTNFIPYNLDADPIAFGWTEERWPTVNQTGKLVF